MNATIKLGCFISPNDIFNIKEYVACLCGCGVKTYHRVITLPICVVCENLYLNNSNKLQTTIIKYYDSTQNMMDYDSKFITLLDELFNNSFNQNGTLVLFDEEFEYVRY